MKLNFNIIHMRAVKPAMGAFGAELIATMIINNHDHVKHCYGLTVEIPEGYVGILLPSPNIVDKIEKVANLGVYTSADNRKELSAIFTLPDDMVHDFYQEGEVSAILIVVPFLKYEIA